MAIAFLRGKISYHSSKVGKFFGATGKRIDSRITGIGEGMAQAFMEKTISSELSKVGEAIGAEEQSVPPASFASMLARHELKLVRGNTSVLQINMGLLCNQRCRHCHLEAGPDRVEMMDEKTTAEIIEFAGRGRFQTVDITGGAPELNNNLATLIENLAGLAPKIMLRSNLTALTDVGRRYLVELCREYKVVLVASFPSLNQGQTDSQRGSGIWEKSIAALKELNAAGYGEPDSGLVLDIVSNPSGAFLPSSQEATEKRFRRDLGSRWGIGFNHLYTFGNVALGRFRKWLIDSGNFESYMRRITESFNPCTIDGLMCRTLVSVSWDGYLYDCDFNLAQAIPMGGRAMHVSEVEGPPKPGTPIAVGEHCYACTAGPGFT
ncbi:MAG: arsenosugar biosynthesis radical SAM protein ArsS [Syntrophobacteraceae bacterium]|nr:arsenosugar biosynthesis radical SAM protein ArsS [Syntrophobacteraceae bacterium]